MMCFTMTWRQAQLDAAHARRESSRLMQVEPLCKGRDCVPCVHLACHAHLDSLRLGLEGGFQDEGVIRRT
jgi:hypothetical protein